VSPHPSRRVRSSKRLVSGIMNLVWIAGIALYAGCEKWLPLGRALNRAAGVGIGPDCPCARNLRTKFYESSRYRSSPRTIGRA
jgi:hypothetical protein